MKSFALLFFTLTVLHCTVGLESRAYVRTPVNGDQKGVQRATDANDRELMIGLGPEDKKTNEPAKEIETEPETKGEKEEEPKMDKVRLC